METVNISVSRFLKSKLETLQEKNKSYSLRAFAGKIGLSPGGLVQILSGKKKLSLERAHIIAAFLKLTGEEKKLFLLSVEFEQAKIPDRKVEVFSKIQSLKSNQIAKYFDLSVDQFKLIADWYGLATLECVSTYGSQFAEKELAKHLNLTVNEASMILERLVRLELIKKEDEKWIRIPGRVLISSLVPNEAIRNHYKSVTQKSIESYDQQTPQEKVAATEVFAFDVNQLEEVRKLTDEYLDKLIAISKTGKNRKSTYQALVNIFRVSKL